MSEYVSAMVPAYSPAMSPSADEQPNRWSVVAPMDGKRLIQDHVSLDDVREQMLQLVNMMERR